MTELGAEEPVTPEMIAHAELENEPRATGLAPIITPHPMPSNQNYLVYERDTGRVVAVGHTVADEIHLQGAGDPNLIPVALPYDVKVGIERLRVDYATGAISVVPLETFVVYDLATGVVIQHGRMVAEDVGLMALDARLVSAVMAEGFEFAPGTRAQDISVNLETGEITGPRNG